LFMKCTCSCPSFSDVSENAGRDTFSLTDLQSLDFSTVRVLHEWVDDWHAKLEARAVRQGLALDVPTPSHSGPW
jgi:hypothetical protein